jgi:hypothetical protein
VDDIHDNDILPIDFSSFFYFFFNPSCLFVGLLYQPIKYLDYLSIEVVLVARLVSSAGAGTITCILGVSS